MDDAFRKLTGNPPFPWQRAWYDLLLAEKYSELATCSIPTGLGKTSVLALWLIAQQNNPRLPRRLVYVVNRRTVVDQTTDEAKKLRDNAEKAGLTQPAISTLRGQFADNREWSADPSRPAIICGTVDMIGSRLLFSGYGVGFKGRPLHAGFLGQDVLLIHDEAHLEPAFQKVLSAIESEQQRCHDRLMKQFHVVELSATARSNQEKPFGLTKTDYTNSEIKKRIRATKQLHLHSAKDPKKIADDLAALALTHRDSGQAILVFVRRVDDVDKLLKKLPGGSARQLTGTMRGKEREELINTPILQRFLPASNRNPEVYPADGTVYLVCTSAGEVGVNISADHLICDLSTFDSMAQRFGRVNRFGECSDTRIDVVHAIAFDVEDELELRLQRTLALLEKLKGDACPAALGELNAQERRDAFQPEPEMLETSPILFDSWALTTIRDGLPGRPPVAPYLHGKEDEKLAETSVGWREEVGEITEELLDTYRPEDLLEDFPLKPHELLRDSTTRIFDKLKKLNASPETPIWIIELDQSVTPTKLGKLLSGNKDALNFKTILLPNEAGGLKDGLLSPDGPPGNNDVAEWWFDEKNEKRRVRMWEVPGKGVPAQLSIAREKMRHLRTIKIPPPDTEEAAEPRFWHWYELPDGGDGDGSRAAKKRVEWSVHTSDVVNHLQSFLPGLSLADEMQTALIVAAQFHDLGKKRQLFQRSLGNHIPELCLAKSGGEPMRYSKYRHEFGSLCDVQVEQEFQSLTTPMQDLVLHLIATHHGRGRPHFPSVEAFDPEPNGANVQQIAADVPLRFARLQTKYGRWGLAWLESLLRAADWNASADPSSYWEDGK